MKNIIRVTPVILLLMSHTTLPMSLGPDKRKKAGDCKLSLQAKRRRLLSVHFSLEQTCAICLKNKILRKFVTLHCQHAQCRQCLEQFVSRGLMALKDTTQNSAQILRCPIPNCSQAMTEEDIRKLSTPQQLQTYYDIAFRECLLRIPGVRHCQTPDCKYSYINDEFIRRSIICPVCHETYCTNCLLPHLDSVTCHEAQSQNLPQSSRQEEGANRRWKHQNTRLCPLCGVEIEKNGGCDFVHCRQCHKYFDWKEAARPYDTKYGSIKLQAKRNR